MRVENRAPSPSHPTSSFAGSESDAPSLSPSKSNELQAWLLDCIGRILRGEQAALAELYDATAGRVHGVALRIVGNVETAEEVVSDVYFQAWREAGRYDPARGAVQSWLMVMCRSRAVDALRRRDDAIIHPEPYSLAENQADGHGDLQELIEAIERGTRIHAVVAALTPVQRQLVALAFFRGHTHCEIADHLRMPLGSVKSTIRQALHAMRGAMAVG